MDNNQKHNLTNRFMGREALYTEQTETAQAISAKKALKDKILRNVAYRMVNKERNAYMLQNAPYIDVLDLAAVYRVEAGIVTLEACIADYKMCAIYDISADELEAAAKANTKRTGFRSKTTLEMFLEAGLPVTEEALENDFTYVLTNESGVMGASIIMFRENFQTVAEKAGEDLYVLPSSIHELLAVPVSVLGAEMLREIVSYVNTKEVSEEEFLSGNVYRYDAAKHSLRIV